MTAQYRVDPIYPSNRPKYENAKGTGVQIYRPNPGGGPVVICEGPLDALVLAQLGADSVTTTGGAGSLAKRLDRTVIRTRSPYLALDRDDAGEDAERKLRAVFPEARRIEWPEGKDISEALLAVEDPGSAWERWLRQIER